MGNQYTCYQCGETLPKPPDGKRYQVHMHPDGSFGYFHKECIEEHPEAYLKMQMEEYEKTFAPDPSRYDSSSKKIEVKILIIITQC